MPALPTTNLTLHCDASTATGNLYTTYVGSGVHTGTPSDGNAIQVWEDEGDGIADVCLTYAGKAAGAAPAWRSTTPLMKLPCLDFDGGSDWLEATTQTGTEYDASAFLSTTAKTILVAFRVDAIATDSANSWQNPPLVCDIDGYMGLHFRSTAGQPRVLAYNYSTADNNVSLDISLATSYVVTLRHASSVLYISLNGGSESSIASGATGNLFGTLVLGKSFTANFYDGRIGEVAVYNTGLTGTALSDANAYFVQKWITGPASFPVRRRPVRIWRT